MVSARDSQPAAGGFEFLMLHLYYEQVAKWLRQRTATPRPRDRAPPCSLINTNIRFNIKKYIQSVLIYVNEY